MKPSKLSLAIALIILLRGMLAMAGTNQPVLIAPSSIVVPKAVYDSLVASNRVMAERLAVIEPKPTNNPPPIPPMAEHALLRTNAAGTPVAPITNYLAWSISNRLEAIRAGTNTVPSNTNQYPGWTLYASQSPTGPWVAQFAIPPGLSNYSTNLSATNPSEFFKVQ